MRRLVALASMLVPVALAACSESGLDAARAVVQQFCDDIAASRVEQARTLLIESERAAGTHQFQPQGLRDGYEVGPARLNGENAHVDVTTKNAPKAVTFVLVRADGTWRISLAASMQLTFGDRFEHVRKMLDTAGKQMVERFQQAQKGQGSGGAPPPSGR